MPIPENVPFLAAEEVPQALENTWKFFMDGGFFMALIVVCSFVALAAIVYKVLTLTRARVLPDRLAGEVERIEHLEDGGSLEQLQREFREGETALARLGAVAITNARRSREDAQEAVQASAREEVVRMHTGLPILEVVITVAPLLGLLGTASGLVVIFGNTEELTSGMNNAKIGAGIARALGTTIAGLVVAVPSVVAHSYFTRKIEMLAARLEVLLGLVVAVSHKRAPGADPPARPAEDPVVGHQFSQLPQ